MKRFVPLAAFFLLAFAGSALPGPIEHAKAALALASPVSNVCDCMHEGSPCLCPDGRCKCGDHCSNAAQAVASISNYYAPAKSCPECEACEKAIRALKGGPVAVTCDGTCGGSYTTGPEPGEGGEQAPRARGDGSKHPVLHRIFHPFKGRQGGGRRHGGGCCGG